MQSLVDMLLKRVPHALWLYIGVSILVAAICIAKIGGLAFQVELWPMALWVVLTIALGAGLRIARYGLIAWQAIAIVQVSLISVGQIYSAGAMILMFLTTLQLALLFAPSFHTEPV
jgi:hypothetical protein